MDQPSFEIFYGDCIEVLKSLPDHLVHSVVTDPPAGISFLNKKWDGDRGGRNQWISWMTDVMSECHRVLKPGGYILVWAIPRTSHWTATAIEDAGFQVKDVISHLFGCGFPKNQSLEKLIAKSNIDGALDESSQCTETVRNNAIDQWLGWGTALKPGNEHWILAQKKPDQTNLSTNLICHGVGALNIDGCRISAKDEIKSTKNIKFGSGLIFDAQNAERDGLYVPHSRGRFPSNVILVDPQNGESSPVDIIDEQAGKTSAKYFKTISPFYYCPKPKKSEKGEFNTHPTVKPIKLMRYLARLITPKGGVVLDPFMGSGTTGVSVLLEESQFIGIEKETEYFQIANRRLEEIYRRERKKHERTRK